MNSNHEPEPEERLEQVLSAWTVDSPLPPRFQEQVWRRIAQAENQPRSALRAGLARLVAVALPRPRFAVAYLGILLGVGIATGSWVAQLKTDHLNADLGSRYIQTIDPYQAPHP